jgi:hypothetical protein
MIELKKLNQEAVQASLERARQYRLLNEPFEAESICLDVLAATPGHQEALNILLLALTDKFGESGLEPAFNEAKKVIAQLDTSHCKAYFTGLIYERRAKFHLRQGGPNSGTVAHAWFTKAMDAYEEALKTCDPDNQDAVLRFNSCARIINTNPAVKPDDNSGGEMLLDPFDTPH